MTTILGIKGVDSKGKTYAILISDTRSTYNENIFTDDTKKILFSKEVDYAYALAGTSLVSKNFPNLLEEVYQFANCDTAGLKDLDNLLKREILSNSPSFLRRINQKLIQEGYVPNDYIFTFQKDNEIKLLEIKGYGDGSMEVKDKSYVAIGSGGDDAFGIVNNHIFNLRTPVWKPIQDSAFVLYKAMKESFNKDKYTGGKIDLAIICKDNKICFRDVDSLINKEPNFFNLLEQKVYSPFNFNIIDSPHLIVKNLQNLRGKIQQKYIEFLINLGDSELIPLILKYAPTSKHEDIIKNSNIKDSPYEAMHCLEYVKDQKSQELLVEIILNDTSNLRINAVMALDYIKDMALKRKIEQRLSA